MSATGLTFLILLIYIYIISFFLAKTKETKIKQLQSLISSCCSSRCKYLFTLLCISVSHNTHRWLAIGGWPQNTASKKTVGSIAARWNHSSAVSQRHPAQAQLTHKSHRYARQNSAARKAAFPTAGLEQPNSRKTEQI